MTDSTHPPANKRLRVMQAVGAVVVALATLASALLGDQYPWINGVTVFVSWGVGKMLGVPIASIVRSAFASMPPAKQVAPIAQAVASMPPAARQDVINQIVFLSSDRPPPRMPPAPVTPPPDEPPRT